MNRVQKLDFFFPLPAGAAPLAENGAALAANNGHNLSGVEGEKSRRQIFIYLFISQLHIKAPTCLAHFLLMLDDSYGGILLSAKTEKQ